MADMAQRVIAASTQAKIILDRNLCIASANPAFCRQAGIRPETLAGIPIGSLAEDAESVPDLMQDLGAVIADGRSLDRYAMSPRVADATGGEFW